MTGETVRAAGGIVVRRDGDGSVEVLLVHRPAYGDWTFPKGKVDGDEEDDSCALREVEEETGLACAIVGEAGETRYSDPRGRSKVVRYFTMKPLGGTLTFLHEVDAARWVGLDDALRLLTYERDRALLEAVRGAIEAA